MGFWGIFFIVVCIGLFIGFVIAVAQGADLGEFFEDLGKIIVFGFLSIVGAISIVFLWIFSMIASLALPLAFVAGVLFLVKWIFF